MSTQVLFIPDRDGDLVPDGEPEVMLDGFDVARGNYHNFANGLRWGRMVGFMADVDTPARKNWVVHPMNRYRIDGGIWRYHPQEGG